MNKEAERNLVSSWASFLKVHARVINEIEKELVKAKVIPLTWYDILLSVNGSPGNRKRMIEIAEGVVLTKSGLSRSVDKLTEAGLIIKEACPEDKRGSYAVITEKGIQALKEAWPIYRKCIHKYFGENLDQGEITTINQAMNKILASLEKANQY
jgi:DNA-binding MarR family transcriptional regulator